MLEKLCKKVANGIAIFGLIDGMGTDSTGTEKVVHGAKFIVYFILILLLFAKNCTEIRKCLHNIIYDNI